MWYIHLPSSGDETVRHYAYFPFPLAVTSEEAAIGAAYEEPEWAVLSIRDAGMEPLTFATRSPQLHLSFDDIQQKPNPWSALSGYVPPSREEAHQIVAFAVDCANGRVPGLLIHCAAGISRSSASCLGVAMALLGNPRTALYELQHAVDRSYERGWRDDLIVHPNRRLVALLDKEMGCDGELLRAMLKEYRSRSGEDVEVTHMMAMRDAVTR
jgi:predicted protein tyrosine phosphatase